MQKAAKIWRIVCLVSLALLVAVSAFTIWLFATSRAHVTAPLASAEQLAGDGFVEGQQVPGYVFSLVSSDSDTPAVWAFSDPTRTISCFKNEQGAYACETASPITGEKSCSWSQTTPPQPTSGRTIVGWLAGNNLEVSCNGGDPSIAPADKQTILGYGNSVDQDGYVFTSTIQGIYAKNKETNQWFLISTNQLETHD